MLSLLIRYAISQPISNPAIRMKLDGSRSRPNSLLNLPTTFWLVVSRGGQKRNVNKLGRTAPNQLEVYI